MRNCFSDLIVRPLGAVDRDLVGRGRLLLALLVTGCAGLLPGIARRRMTNRARVGLGSRVLLGLRCRRGRCRGCRNTPRPRWTIWNCLV
jgi:hypothetical protein